MMLLKRAFVLLFAVGAGQALLAQDASEQVVENVFRVNLKNPGLGYELAAGKRSTVMGQIFLSPYAAFNYSSALGSEFEFRMEPKIAFQYRHYYNFKNRQQKGQRTELNSMNYFGPVIESVFSKRRISTSYYAEERKRAINTVGFVWGLQRNLEKRLSLDLNAGIGFLFTTGLRPDEFSVIRRVNIRQFAYVGSFTLGFWLNKRPAPKNLPERIQ